MYGEQEMEGEEGTRLEPSSNADYEEDSAQHQPQQQQQQQQQEPQQQLTYDELLYQCYELQERD